MVIIEIDGTSYHIPQGWCDVPYKKYMAFVLEVMPTMPPKLKELHNAEGEKRQKIALGISDLYHRKHIFPYYLRVIAALSDIPYSLLLKCNTAQVIGIYNGIIKGLAEPAQWTYTAKETIGGVEFNYPSRFMRQEKAGEYIEAANFEDTVQKMGGDLLAAIPQMACCLLKKDGEQYTGDIDESKTGWFVENMNMANCWGIYFFLQRSNASFAAVSKMYSIPNIQPTK